MRVTHRQLLDQGVGEGSWGECKPQVLIRRCNKTRSLPPALGSRCVWARVAVGKNSISSVLMRTFKDLLSSPQRSSLDPLGPTSTDHLSSNGDPSLVPLQVPRLLPTQ